MRGGTPAWGLSVGLTTPQCKKNKHLMKRLKQLWAWQDSLDKLSKLWNTHMRFDMSNARSL
jgi:hypothetical protein